MRKAASKLETELGVGGQSWDLATLRSSETFLRTEVALQTLVETGLLEKPSADQLELAKKRLGGFWPAQMPDVKLHWQVIAECAEVILLSQSVRQALKAQQSATALLDRYTAEDGWHRLDTLQRHLERDSHNYDLEPPATDSLLKLLAAAQQAYAETAHALASQFVHACEAAGFSLPGARQQSQTYRDYVESSANQEPTAYILVDALRYEMARELCAQLPSEWKVDLVPALAAAPTITEIGMACLMPGADRGFSITSFGPGKLGVQIGDGLLGSRADRVKWFAQRAPQPVVVTELNRIAPLKDKHLIAEIKRARSILVTASDEIDGLWENQPQLARQLHDHVFEQLRRGIRSLFSHGIAKVILTADHGFLMGDRLMVGEPLDAPGGNTADLHRRVWMGKGGTTPSECLRKPLSAFGMGGDLELVTPYGISCFKVQGGSSEYFHGGLSLQEVIVPILSVAPGAAKLSAGTAAFKWSIKLGSQKVTTRFYTVTIEGESSDLFAMPPRVHVELRAGNQVISVPVSASYGFNETTRDVSMTFDEGKQGQLVANAVTLQITEVPQVDAAKLYLLDELGTSLTQETSIPLAIAL